MKTLRKTVCLLLALLMLGSAVSLASCGDGGKKPDETTAAVVQDSSGGETTAEDTSPKFPEADYGGEKFGVYMRTSTLNHYGAKYIFAAEGAMDIVNEQATIRNQTVEDRYNIEFEFIEKDSPESTIKNDVAGGEIPYKVILAQRNCLMGSIYAGLMRNFNDLDIDYTTTWWDANAADAYSYDGKLYVMPNDTSVANLGGSRFYWFNRKVLEDFKLKSPYEFVAENQWTLENFFGLVKSVSAPGTEGQFGVYGLSNEEGSNRMHMLTGIGSFRVEIDEDGNLVCKIGTDYADKTQDFFDQLKAVVTDSNICLEFSQARALDAANQNKYVDQYYHTRALFSQGHFLFTHTGMGGSMQFEESEKGLSPVMNPKYNSDQEKYYHQMDANALIWCMAKDPNADLEQIANVMDFWAYTSSHTVMEAYYELTLKTKRAVDPETAQMLDTIKGSIRYYLTDIFTVDIGSFITAAYNQSVASAWAVMQKKLPGDLKKVQDRIEALED